MKSRNFSLGKTPYALAVLLLAMPGIALADPTLPGVVDPGRMGAKQEIAPPREPAGTLVLTTPQAEPAIPESAEYVSFELNSVALKGVTAFSKEELADTYAPFISKKVTLKQIYRIAYAITERYRAKGYFLSRAYIPEQEITNGNLTIAVVEGFIGDVAIEGEQPSLILSLIERLKKEKPVSAYSLESFMLHLNALPGALYVAGLEPLERDEEGAVKLLIQAKPKTAQGVVSFDNSGSKFLGPHEVSLRYKRSLLPLQETMFSVITSTPTNELNYFGLDHTIAFLPDWTLNLGVNTAKSHPGDTLSAEEIKSNSTEVTAGFTYQPIRQIQQNLSFTTEVRGRNTNSDFLGSNPLTRDRIRLISAGVYYDRLDPWNGSHALRMELEKGIDILGASKKGDADLSRIEATLDFNVLKLDYQQQRKLDQDWLVVAQISGQKSSKPLFSALQFGYGGQTFGRAYNPSEITGDDGVAAMAELRYDDLKLWQNARLSPYAFYDIGKVWNQATNGETLSASSAGFGIRTAFDSGVSSNMGLAWPLTREAANPIYGENAKDPRFFFSLGYQF